MKYKKKTIWTALLCIILALALTGCGVVLGTATDNNETQTIDSSTISGIGNVDATTTPDIVDFDGDGIADSASIKADSQEYATLTVTLGKGTALEKKFDGWWWPQDTTTGNSDASGNDLPVQTGDFNADGKDDILLALLYAGSSGENRVVHVLRVENDELVEYPTNYITSGANYEIDKTLTDFGADCMGAWVVNNGEKALIQIREYSETMAGNDSALYFTVAFNGNGWQIQSVNSGKAYSHEVDGEARAAEASQTLPSVTRNGFVNADITIIEQPVTVSADDGDHDPAMKDDPLTEDIAQRALRELYNMTGVLVDKCYATGNNNHVQFSLDSKDFNLKCFYSADFDNNGRCTGMSIAYASDTVDYSPIDPSSVVKPDDLSSMTDAEIAQWYYKNSSFGDRFAVKSTIDYMNYGIPGLVLENGGCIAVDIDEATKLPYSFIGLLSK